jgi:hypothetical protein
VSRFSNLVHQELQQTLDKPGHRNRIAKEERNMTTVFLFCITLAGFVGHQDFNPGFFNTNIPRYQKSSSTLLDIMSSPRQGQCISSAYGCQTVNSCEAPLCNIIGNGTLEKGSSRDACNRWGIGIGISGGLCWGGAQLKQTSEPLDVAAFFDWWYWLNSFEAYSSYVLNEKWVLEAGVIYGWANLLGRKGLESVRVPNARDNIRGSLATSPDWDLRKMSLFVAGVKDGTLSFGVEITHAFASTKEAIWAPWIIEEAAVTRNCFGGGIFVLLKFNYKQDKRFNILPYVGGRLAFAYEYDNDSPWENRWHERLCVSFSGIYVGLQFALGGVL